jgi:hypothetical protein
MAKWREHLLEVLDVTTVQTNTQTKETSIDYGSHVYRGFCRSVQGRRIYRGADNK